MTDKPTQATQDAAPARARKRRGLLHRLFRLVVLLAVILAIAAAAVKFYIAPMLIAREVKKGLGDYWVGSVEVGGVEFNYFGPILLHGLVLRDQEGQTWLAEDRLTVELEDWPSLKPRITQLKLRRPAVTTYEGKGFPLTAPAAEGEPFDMLDLQNVLVDGAELTLVRTDGRRQTLAGVRIEASLRGRKWQVRAQFGQSADAHVLTGWAWREDRQDGSTVIEFAGQTTFPGAEATIAASVATPADPTGKLVASLDVVAYMCGGRANLRAGAIVPAEGSPRFNVDLLAAGLDLRTFTTTWEFDEPLDGKVVQLEVDASFSSASLDGLKINGLLALDDMTVLSGSILKRILAAISPEWIREDRSDVQAVFSLDWPIVTVHSGSIGGELIALDIESGSTINLSTHELNGVVVVVIMKDISRVLGALPMMSAIADISRSLKRYSITGTWDKPVPIPRPMAALAGRFLQDVVSSRGGLRGLMFTPMQGIFDALPPLIPLNGN